MKIFFKIFFLLILCLSVFSIKAQDFNNREQGTSQKDSRASENSQEQKTDTIKLRLINYKIDPTLGDLKFVKPDTFPYNFQNNAFPERNNNIISQNLANIGGPIQSVIFNERKNKTSFLFMNAYDSWIQTPDEFVFHNTTKPVSNLTYLTTVGNKVSQEDDFKFTFYVNPNKNLNVGFDIEKISARGFYDRNSSRNTLFNLFGNYVGNKYNAFWKISSYSNENFENGGISDDRYITDPATMSGGEKEYESLNIPVNLSNDRSKVKNNSFFFSHKYNIGKPNIKEATFNPDGSPVRHKKDEKLFIPVASIFNSLYFSKSTKQYLSDQPISAFYDSVTNISNTSTNDQTELFYSKTSLGVGLNEGFRNWVFADLKGFITYESKKYTYFNPSSTLSDSTDAYSRTSNYDLHNIWAGVNSSRHLGNHFNYDATGKLVIEGENAGDYNLSGTIYTKYKIGKFDLDVNMYGQTTGKSPDYLTENYYSNALIWNKQFDRELSTKLGGNIASKATGTNIELTVENKTNYIYFGTDYLPTQYDGNLQILTAEFDQKLNLGILHFDNKLIYQKSSNETVLDLPDLSLYSNLYIKTYLSKVLLTYLGVDCRYFTEYYAQGYMPTTEQFYNQTAVKIGNYPYMNAYLNFRLKTMRFFIMDSHISRLFVEPNYFNTPHYPLNPSTFKIGFSWNFFS